MNTMVYYLACVITLVLDIITILFLVPTVVLVWSTKVIAEWKQGLTNDMCRPASSASREDRREGGTDDSI
jgi:hypothetical protein